jgi:hypothetical protein
MLQLKNRFWLLSIACVSCVSTFFAIAILADEIKEFSQLTLVLGFNKSKAVVTGYTGGSYSLSSIANSDRDGNTCIGYGDPEPDHTMILEKDLPSLILRVNSLGKDTTLVIKGPDKNTIRCSFGQNDTQDAVIQDRNWQAGRYQIWVGSLESNGRFNYSLSAQP